MYTMGDKPTQPSFKSTGTSPAISSANAATQVQTVADVKPTEPSKEEIKLESTAKPVPADLQAYFIRDRIADGSKLPTGLQFQQVWTLRNPGPDVWPAGCSVRFIGGDNDMLNVDPEHPSSTSDLNNATESNVIGREVRINEEVDFCVTMKTPQRAGKAISYWRLKAADGTPFGHKLWCDIDVVMPIVKSIPQEAGTEHVEDISKAVRAESPPIDEAKESRDGDHHSQMIFPKLDKESPVSSTHEGLIVQEQRSAAPSVSAEDQELLEEVESLELDDEDETDDGFMTDEEYEILDVDGSEDEAINGKK